MKSSSILIALPLLVLIGCGPAPQPPAPASKPKAPTLYTNSESVVDAPANYVGAVLSQKVQVENRMDLTMLRKAIEAFQQGEERYPATLNELVEKNYLKSMPQPPKGMQFQYNPADGSIQIVPAS